MKKGYGDDYKMDKYYSAIIVGKRYGQLIATKKDANDKMGHSKWICNCDCGKTVSVRGDNLKSGNTKSCGCQITVGRSTHGMWGKRIYHIWADMIKRCYNMKCSSYPRYGGRGITVCDEWRNNVTAFYDWAIENGYNDNLTIDRIDNNGNYCPENCQWLTLSENSKKLFRDRKMNSVLTHVSSY